MAISIILPPPNKMIREPNILPFESKWSWQLDLTKLQKVKLKLYKNVVPGDWTSNCIISIVPN